MKRGPTGFTFLAYLRCTTRRACTAYDRGSHTSFGWTQSFADTVRLRFRLNVASVSVLVLPAGQSVG